ncbi:hypothetical protein CTI12_AA565800 [Artemisia annua]|uniref:Uncharacterized protein n=1 Tax=Artemisia annua TaxID=35608 RepID=A0A2U1KTQ8_ARTAN|nr:hypothetical protein CTI12_AA565800 [Artemisia annua]
MDVDSDVVVTADDGVQTSSDILADSSKAIPAADDTMESADQGVKDSATDPLHHVSAGQPTTKVPTDAASTVTPVTIPAVAVPSIVSTDQSGVSADKPTDPASIGINKGKSVMLEPALPSRKKSKKELELERLSEQVAANLVAADLANEAKRQEELSGSEKVQESSTDPIPSVKVSSVVPPDIVASEASKPNEDSTNALPEDLLRGSTTDNIPPESSIWEMVDSKRQRYLGFNMRRITNYILIKKSISRRLYFQEVEMQKVIVDQRKARAASGSHEEDSDIFSRRHDPNAIKEHLLKITTDHRSHMASKRGKTRMAGQLSAFAYALSDHAEGEDLWLISTCSINLNVHLSDRPLGGTYVNSRCRHPIGEGK